MNLHQKRETFRALSKIPEFFLASPPVAAPWAWFNMPNLLRIGMIWQKKNFLLKFQKPSFGLYLDGHIVHHTKVSVMEFRTKFRCFFCLLSVSILRFCKSKQKKQRNFVGNCITQTSIHIPFVFAGVL